MNGTTRLQALDPGRARELFQMLKTVQNDDSKGLALNDQGCVTGIVDVGDQQTEHLLGDLDVHA